MRWRIGSCLLAAAIASCAGAQQPAGAPDLAHQRSLAMAVPFDANVAVLLDRPWTKTAASREVAARLGVVKQYGTAMLAVRGMLGFDPTDPAEVRAHGFDDQGGVGFFVLPANTVPVFFVGIADPQRAQQTVQRILQGIEERETAEKLVVETRAVPSGDGVTVLRRARGDVRAAYLLHGGFLYLRLPGAGDPVRDLARVTAVEPGRSLDREPGFAALAPRLAAADAVLYFSELPSQQTWPAAIRVAKGAAIALEVHPDGLGFRFHGRRETDPNRSEPQTLPAPRVDLAAGLPADAMLWVHVSCSPTLLWSELSKNMPDPRQVAQFLQTMFGADADREVRSSFTGNFAMGIYPSAARLRGGAPGTSRDSPGLVLVAELAEGRESAIEAILDRGTENLSRKTPAAVQRRVASGMPLWRIAGEAIVALHGQRLIALLPAPGGNVAGAPGEAEAPRNGAPPRWPPEATASELGVFSEMLRSGRSPLREQLHKVHADEDPGPSHVVVRASGAILDFPALVRSFLDVKGTEGKQLVGVNELLRHASAAFQKARFDWQLGRDTMDAELQWNLPEKVVAAEAPPAVAQGERLRNALREAQRLAKDDPDRVAAHEDLATLLLDASAGTAAREEARRATSLAPGDARAHLLLARVLEHDVLGRRWHVGLDSGGAEAALRKAEEIDPKSYEARVGLALLLERDKGGQRDFSEARLPRVVEEVRAIRDAWARGDLNGRADERLLEAELFAGLWTEMLADAPRIPESETRDAFALAARAASQGPDSAAKDSERIGNAATREKTLTRAVSLLDIARRYAEAAGLARAAASVVPDGSALSKRAAQDAKVTRVEPPRQPPSNPAVMVEQAAMAAYDPRVPAAELAQFLATDSPISKPAVRAALLAITAERRAELLATDVSVASARDYFHSLSDARVEGDRDSGFRVELRSESVADLWWLVDDGGRPKVLCRAACTAGLGGRALSLAEAGKPDLARRVLDWARDALPKDDARRDAHATLFASVWNGDAARVRLAAAVAASDGAQSARAIPALAEAVKSADPPLRDRLRVALGMARLGSKDAEGALQSIEGVDPAAVPEVRNVRVATLLRLKRFAEAKGAIDEWLERAPDDPFALLDALRYGQLVDDLGRIEGPARKLIAAKKFVSGAANTLAWAKYCHGRLDEDAVQIAEMTSRSGNAAAVNTLATLYAETGRLDQARQTVLKSIDANGALRDDGEVGFADRYVLARIWEGYGLEELAAAEYRKLSGSTEKEAEGRECIAAAARRRLAGLRGVQ